MEIHTTRTDGTTVVSILGKLDTRTSPEFARQAAGWPAGPMVLDLAGLEYLSSAGLRALLQFRRDLAKKGATVVIAGSSGIVDRVLRVSGFEQVFTLYPAVPEAVSAVTAGGA